MGHSQKLIKIICWHSTHMVVIVIVYISHWMLCLKSILVTEIWASCNLWLIDFQSLNDGASYVMSDSLHTDREWSNHKLVGSILLAQAWPKMKYIVQFFPIIFRHVTCWSSSRFTCPSLPFGRKMALQVLWCQMKHVWETSRMYYVHNSGCSLVIQPVRILAFVLDHKMLCDHDC